MAGTSLHKERAEPLPEGARRVGRPAIKQRALEIGGTKIHRIGTNGQQT